MKTRFLLFLWLLIGLTFTVASAQDVYVTSSPNGNFPHGSVGYASGLISGQFETGQKAKVKGPIASRDGDLINVKDTKTGLVVVVNVSDDTKFERKKGAFKFRREDMDVTAMVPGLGIEAEGVGNAQGQLDATKISFSPDDFAIIVAQEQQNIPMRRATQRCTLPLQTPMLRAVRRIGEWT